MHCAPFGSLFKDVHRQAHATGLLNLQVQYGKQEKKLVLVVVAGDGPSLFGRKLLKYLKLDWSSIVAVRRVKVKLLNTLMNQYQAFFSDELSYVTPRKASFE